jgi:protein-S-isoprenylcysteine O-methyltransferase Ste14
MMNKVIQYIVIGCVSFTFSCLFYLLFSFLNIFPVFNEKMLISVLLVSFGIICLIALMNLFYIQNLILLRFLEIMIVVAVLFLAGVILNMFPLNWYYSGFVMITGLLTYVIVIVISFMSNRASARQINASIREKERFV